MRQIKITKQITNREEASLDKYLNDISKESRIALQEEVELARRIREGDEEALKRLVNANLRFVVSVAKQYQNQGLSLPDLINEGNLGLIKAARRFDETRGFKFISYAVWWIRQSILQALADNARLVRLPSNRIGASQRVYRIQGELEQVYGREPSIEEVAEALDMKLTDVIEAIHSGSKPYSVDAPMQDGEDGSFLDVFADSNLPDPDRGLMDSSLQIELKRGLDSLSEREREVLELLYGLNGIVPVCLEEVAHRLQLSRERVRQIRDYAIRRIRQLSNMSVLRTYL